MTSKVASKIQLKPSVTPLLCRVWQMRRVVITKEEISFAFVGSEAQIDHISFSEIHYIKEMTHAAGDDHDDEGSKNFLHVMQIATRDDGYNSGRIYYLSTESHESLHELISYLAKKAKVAREHAEARTGFRKFQLRVRRRYESRKFQGFMALLIIAVGSILVHLCNTASALTKIVPLHRTSGARFSSQNTFPCLHTRTARQQEPPISSTI